MKNKVIILILLMLGMFDGYGQNYFEIQLDFYQKEKYPDLIPIQDEIEISSLQISGGSWFKEYNKLGCNDIFLALVQFNFYNLVIRVIIVYFAKKIKI